jgi:hypothetical protein
MNRRLATPSRSIGLWWGAAGLLLAGCSGRSHVEPPPRATDAVPAPGESSVIAVPIDADSAALTRAIEGAVPKTLWTIDRHLDQCIAPQRIKLFGKRRKVTPAIGCTVTGVVTRGPIRLRGAGHDIIADMPLRARISARDVGGVLKGETATGSAMAHARIRLSVAPDWTPRGTVKLYYDWTTPPGIDFLGQRITFADKADEKLKPVVRKLEATLPRELARVKLRDDVARLWAQSFTSVQLNGDNPPVWMRITPRRLFYRDYALSGGRLHLDLGMEAVTESFVGPRPPDPAPAPLPKLERSDAKRQLRFFIPVVADYAELEPVILRALVKRSARPFDLPRIGPVTARFDKVVAYGTTGGRIAVGIALAAKRASRGGAPTTGTIWLAAHPVNAPGSAKVSFDDLTVTGDTNGIAGDLLIELGNSPVVSALIAGALGQNFTGDLDDLLGKIRRAIADKRVGDFVIHADLTEVETGRIEAHGQGLYLPVRVGGDARITYQPTR